MQDRKFLRGKKFQQDNNLDDFGKKIWRAVTRWSGETGEVNPLDVMAHRLNLTTKTVRDRLANHMGWSLWELKQLREMIGEEVRQIIHEYIG